MRPSFHLLLLVFTAAACALAGAAHAAGAGDLVRWERESRNVTIYRDNWGIAHVYGKTDADAVFGMEYAQAEDDFNRVESNYIDALGWRSQAEGQSAIYRDLRDQLFVDREALRAEYGRSPQWLQKLMSAFADGLNYYLYTHPRVRPKVIRHFEPWMALAFSEGSIGGDIEQGVDIPRLAAFYGGQALPAPQAASAALPPPESQGSNGIAISPSIALDQHALLWINPHTSFYFRSELQMVSEDGLDAYGAVTWGQFFVYQGFNATAGWMHTSSGVQNISWFLETVTRRDGRYYYRYGDRELPVRTRRIVVRFKTPNGMAEKAFTAYYTQHGPIIARVGNKWESVNLMQHPIGALIQDFTRTKAADYAQFRKTMQLHTNSSNNTVFADAEGNIAYWHSDWIPRRSDAFDWGRPVDGSNPATAFHGLLPLDETPHLLNPPNGWVYNSNNWPWSAAGPYSPQRQAFPQYVERGREETPRGHHALKVLTDGRNWTMASLTAAAFDSYLPAFATMIPVLVKAYDAAPASDPVKQRLARQITVLRAWNYRWGVDSVATSLAVLWGTDIFAHVQARARTMGISPEDYVVQRATREQLLASLAAASARLAADFGTWQTPWGDINRFQRINDHILPSFDDSRPSIPVPFTSSAWGSLAAFGAHPYPNTRKWYGDVGNSFVAVVEFGPKVRAWAITAGGESGDPAAAHFADQATQYAMGDLRPVYYYRSQLEGHIERQYHPGEEGARE
ncbi:MAG TPA: penicillin acylase family protein [Steroidobacteraceae bacterium]|jgi:acyl-homoserine-lactone acylase|nr:penicillin acylase family protein [Steroidobacteraceae bacterium]